MAGALALLGISDLHRLKRELEKDSSFLLVRPESEVDLFVQPASREDQIKRLGAVVDVGAVELCRQKLIESAGRLRVRAARNNLKAIEADSGNRLFENSARKARSAIAMIDGMETTEGSSEAQFIPYSPSQYP